MEQQGSYMHIVQLVEHSIEGTLANIDPILTDGGQGRERVAAHGDVVKTHDADIVRNPQTHFFQMHHHTVGQQIVAADDGGAAGIQNPGQVLRQTIIDKIRVTGQRFIHV